MAPSDPGEFGRRLRRLREAAALSQEELAERANVTAKAVGALERGERRRPYPTTVRALSEALSLDDEAARDLADAVRAATPAAPAPPSAPSAAPVPSPPTPMLGRAAERAHLTALLGDEGTRMVTVTGPGGVGKTRLALDVARHLQAEGRDVVVVELAAVRRVDLVVPTIARALGLRAGADDLVGALAVLVADRTPVLVLDNLEHLRDAAPALAELLARCPGLEVLATSRAALRIRAEHEVPLGPLPVPPDGSDVATVASAEAVRVFTDRARRLVPGFEVTAANAAAVGAICRRLDGLPLALELAAAHVQYLAPDQLLDRLGHAVGSARLRDLPERQQTMRATLDWSHALLTADERDVLGALTVFAGGFDLEGAEVVAAAPGRDVLVALQGLVEQSLVVRDDGHDGAPPRLRILEPVRDHAAPAGTEAAGALADRHAAHLASLGAAARDRLQSPDLPEWLDRLQAEHANLRAALTTLVDGGDLDVAAHLGRDTWLYWALRGHAGEGLTWWQRVLDVDTGGDLDDGGTASAHLALAGLRLATGDLPGVRDHARGAAAAAERAEQPTVRAEALLLGAMGATFMADVDAAGAQLGALRGLGPVADRPYPRAHEHIVRSQVALVRGDLGAGHAALCEAEVLGRGPAGPFTLATVLNMQATVALLGGDDDEALVRAGEAARVAAEVGTTWTLVYTLPALGVLATRRDRPELAAALFGAGEAMAEASLLSIAFRPDLEAAALHLAEVRLRLSPDALARAWERGRALDGDGVVALLPEISAPAPR